MTGHEHSHWGASFLFVVIAFLSGCGGGGSDNSSSQGGAEGSNLPPAFTSPTSFTFREDENILFDVSVDDPDGDVVIITDETGGDGALFTLILPDALVIANTSNGRFDFENPVDVDRNNVYEQRIALSDGKTRVVETVKITITNVDEPADCTPDELITITETTTGAIHTFVLNDPETGPVATQFTDLDVSVSGSDLNLSNAVSLDGTSGVVSLIAPLDAEAIGPTTIVTIRARAEVPNAQLIRTCSVDLRVEDVQGRATSGYKFSGTQPNESLGSFIASAGDLDGDGLGELWVSNFPFDNGDQNAPDPTGFLFFGSAIRDELADDGAGEITTAQFGPEQGLKVVGPFKPRPGGVVPRDDSAIDENRVAIALDDINGGGAPELLLAARSDAAGGVAAYLLWGEALVGDDDGLIDLATLNPAQGVVITRPDTFVGDTIALGAGDFDGDKVVDLALGLTQADTHSAQVYVIFGSTLAQVTSGLFSMTTAAGNEMVSITGNALFQRIGHGVISAGNLNGDGADELAFARINGEAYVLFSDAIATAAQGTGVINLLDDALPPELVTIRATDDTLNSFLLEPAGDVDGDTLPDLLIGYRGYGELTTLVFGEQIVEELTDDNVLTTPSAGPTVNTNTYGNPSSGGTPERPGLINLGDLDNDGMDEIAFGGLPQFGRPGTVVVAGGDTLTNRLATSVSSHSVNSILRSGPSVRLVGISANDDIGRIVAGLGDIDGDGIADLAIGAPLASPDANRDKAGEVYVVRSADLLQAFLGDQSDISLEALFRNEMP